jgi:predicted HNH restriction endonuclease
MWPVCREHGVAAVAYGPFEGIDLAEYPNGEPQELWAKLKPTQKASFGRVAYEMKTDDTIYVKEGPYIVGKGRVLGSYKYDQENRIREPRGYYWNHQVPVKWQTDFTAIRVLLGAEPITVLRLTPKRVRTLERRIAQGRAYREGAIARVEGNRYERDRLARAACLAKHGTRCRVCDLSFDERYGDIGKDFIHVHHLKPLGTIRKEYRIDPEIDLIPVCPNCHAMLHTNEPPLSVAELKARLRP